MSGESLAHWPPWIFSMSGRAVKVYGVLVAHRNRHGGECNPSLKTIASEADVSVPTVQRAIRELVAAGLMLKRAGHGRDRSTTAYRLPFEERAERGEEATP